MTFTRRDLATLTDIVTDAARREVMPRFRNLAEADIRQKKSATDLVTEADEQAERLITRELARAFPGALIVGEEAATANPALVTQIAGAELAFVIDPVDGTLNFASDMPLFAVMAAAMVKGESVAAIIHDPVVDDCALALRGEGAWLALNDGRTRDLAVAPAAPMGELTAMISAKYFPLPHRASLPARFPHFADVSSLRCCGHEYRLQAAGHLHVTLYGSLNPWDHAPGTLIVSEAGGHVRFLDGSPYRAGGHQLGLLSAPDAASWDMIRDTLFSP